MVLYVLIFLIRASIGRENAILEQKSTRALANRNHPLKLLIQYLQISHLSFNISVRPQSHHEYGSFNKMAANQYPINKRQSLLQAILTSNAIIAVWISAIANFMGIQVTMQFSPTYLNKVIDISICIDQIVSPGVSMYVSGYGLSHRTNRSLQCHTTGERITRATCCLQNLELYNIGLTILLH